MRVFDGTVTTKDGVPIPHYPLTLVAVGGVLAAFLEAFGPILPEPYSRWAGVILAVLTTAAVWSARIQLIYHTLDTRTVAARQIAWNVTKAGDGYVSFDKQVTQEDVDHIKAAIKAHFDAKSASEVSTQPPQGTTEPIAVPTATEDNR